MNLSFKGIVNLLFTRVILIYLFMVVAAFQIMDVNGALFRARMQTLNRIRPHDMWRIPFLNEKKDIVSADLIKDVLDYAIKIKQYRPQEKGINSVIAYCYYYLNDVPLATEYYLRDLRENPQYFWTQYNLGLIYFKQGDFDKSAQYLQSVLKLQPATSIEMMKDWNVYHQIISQQQTEDKIWPGQPMNEIYQNIYKMLLVGYEKSGNYEVIQTLAQIALAMDIGGNDVFNYYAGLEWLHKKDMVKSLYFFKKAIEENQIMPQPYYYMGQILALMGNPQLSEQLILDSQKLGGHDQPLLNTGNLNVRLY